MKSALLALLLCAGAASPAYAHPRLLHSRPAAGEIVVAGVVVELRLVFNETPELAPSRAQLIGPDGRNLALSLGRAADDPQALVATLPALAAGRYIVRWQVVGTDGHMARGSFSFAAATRGISTGGASDSAIPSPTPTPPSESAVEPFDVSSPAFVAARWLMYVALMALLGAIGFVSLVLPRATRQIPLTQGLVTTLHRRAATLGVAGCAALLIALIARLFAQSATMADPGMALTSTMPMLLTATTWGYAWQAQVALTVGAGIILALVTGNRIQARRRPWMITAALGILLCVATAFSGHAAAGPLAPWTVTADTLHILSAGAWLGTLLVVLTVGIPSIPRFSDSDPSTGIASIVAAFSSIALASAAMLVSTGVFAAWVHVGTIGALWQTTYGRTLLLKLGILSTVAATGAYNWRWVQPTLGRPGAAGALATDRLRRSATVELVAGTLVILVTAILVALPTPHT